MCGIAGLKRMGGQNESDPIERDQISALLLEIQKRGGDATGVCFSHWDGSLVWHKDRKIAWEFLKSPAYERWVEENLTPAVESVILHTRAWTVGPPTDNNNNHPLVNPEAPVAAVVHNGVINNYSEMFREMKLKNVGDVDSDIIRAVIDEHGFSHKAVRQLNRLKGGAAIAVLDSRFPGQMMLGRSGYPLVLGVLEDSNQMVFASTKEAIHKCARRWVEHWGLPFQRNRADLKFNPFEKESVYILDRNGVVLHDEFDVSYGRTFDVRYDVHGKFEEKQARLGPVPQRKALVIEGPDKKIYTCPNPKCGSKGIKMAPHQREAKIPLWKLRCPDCKLPMGTPPAGVLN